MRAFAELAPSRRLQPITRQRQLLIHLPSIAWVNCPVWTNRTNDFYKSPEFLAVEADNQDFLNSLKPIVGNRSIALSNMYNLFDFLNVQSIHNATFAAEVNATGSNTLARARDLAK